MSTPLSRSLIDPYADRVPAPHFVDSRSYRYTHRYILRHAHHYAYRRTHRYTHCYMCGQLASELLQNNPGSTAVVISTELISQSLYHGHEKAMLLQACNHL